ncbi:MAG TPA: hypothetical protein VGP93_20620 [Polyangiaceae bacterium]|nr:hypothetical protein [Polyangiaceae bacterium]
MDMSSDREELERTLQALGLQRKTYRALMLLPLIYVAWADGKMERVEIKRIREIASQRLHLSPETMSALDRWLKKCPPRAHVEKGLEGLLGLALDDGYLDVDVSELPDLVVHAESIARATGKAFDDPTAISPEEDLALKDIARLLEVDGGATWKEVLEELRSRAPKPPKGS